MDPFGYGEGASAPPPAEVTHEPPAEKSAAPTEPAVDPAIEQERIAEMERVLDNFGQRRPDNYGRRGKPGRRGR